MNISGHFINRPVFTTLLMVVVVFFGSIAYKSLPVSALPDVSYPTIEVSASYPGASPKVMSNRITSPLENHLAGIEGLKTMISNSSRSSTRIVLQFQLNKNMELALIEVESKISQSLSDLPDLPSNPSFQKKNPSESPILYFALSSKTLPESVLYDYGHSIVQKKLQLLPGVSFVDLYGSPFAVRVKVDPKKLAAKNVSIQNVISAIQDGNPQIPAGYIEGPSKEYILNVDGQLHQGKQYGDLMVKNDQGSILRIRDVASTIDSLSNTSISQAAYTKESGLSTCIVLGIVKSPTANTLDVIQSVKNEIPKLKEKIPSSIEMFPIFDKSNWILDAIDDVKMTLIIAFILVLLVILFYFGKIIDTFIPVITLPITIVGTFAVVYLLGYSINILTLLAITLSIGFLVDDAIVVLENIVRYLEKGQTPEEAAHNGTKQIMFTIIATSFCLAAVFIPMLFVQDIIGRIFREFCITIIVAIIISTFISISLTPLLAKNLLTQEKVKSSNRLKKISSSINQRLQQVYKRSLSFALQYKKSILSLGVLSIILVGFLFVSLPKDLFPPDDLGSMSGLIMTESGTSASRLKEQAKEITDILSQNPYIDKFGFISSVPEENQGIVFITLVPKKERPPIDTVISSLEKQFQTLVGINVFLSPIPLIKIQSGPEQTQGNVQLLLSSFELDDLYTQAEVFEQALKTEPLFSQVHSNLHLGMPHLEMSINRNYANYLNISAQEIEETVMYNYARSEISRINTPNYQYRVLIQSSDTDQPDIDSNVFFAPSSNNLPMIPLGQVVDQKEVSGPTSIMHFNTLPSVQFSLSTMDIPYGETVDIVNSLKKDLKPTTSISTLGITELFLSTITALIVLFFITLFIIYVILGILYENFIHPITIMSTLPPSLLGGLFTLMLFNQALSIYSFVGLIMLMGIVLKNGIMMVDFANENRKKHHMSTEKAIFNAAVTRFRPILMTTFSTFMGVIPIALGLGGETAQSRIPLGSAVAGGLIISQILTLYLTPIIYIMLEKLRHHSLSRMKRIKASD